MRSLRPLRGLTWAVLLTASVSPAIAQTVPTAPPAEPGPAAQTAPDVGQKAPPAGVGPSVDSQGDIKEGPPEISQGEPFPRRPATAGTGAGTAAAGKAPAAAPGSPFKPLFFDNDFSAYVDKPPYVLGEELKLLPLLDDGPTLSVGGQLRHRYADEINRIAPGGPGVNTYQLWRSRLYGDYKSDLFRVYVEGIDAAQFGEDLPQTTIDVNRADLQNAFIDAYVIDDDDWGKGTFRYGRQELLYGDQHLISPLDWGNTRRNFEGFKYFHQFDDLRVDLFSVNPLNNAAVGTGRRTATQGNTSFDHADQLQRLSGMYATYTGIKNVTAEAFYLYSADRASLQDFADGDRSTVGGRVAGTVPVSAGKKVLRTWDYDLFGAYQFGADDGQDVQAGAVNATAGHTWNATPWAPRIGGLFYYGSGDDDPNDGTTNTFNTLYPLGHAYWGILDNLSGQNLVDYSIQASVKPTKKFGLIGQYHYFDKASSNDFLYNVAKVPIGSQTSGQSHIGQEFDIIATYDVNPNLQFQTGYAYFMYGDFVTNNLPRNDAQFYYFMTTFNF